MTPRAPIVGAGLAGLAGLVAADRLLARNIELMLIDEGRRLLRWHPIPRMEQFSWSKPLPIGRWR